MDKKPLDHVRRFVFHGTAAALGGRIVRRGDGAKAQLLHNGFIDVPGSLLSVTGGRSTAVIPGHCLQGDAAAVVKFDRAQTFAEGIYTDLKGHYEVTLGKRQPSELATTTRVSASVEGLEIGTAIRLTIDRFHAGLIARSAAASGETPVEIDDKTDFENVRVSDAKGQVYALSIELDPTPFCQHATYSQLMAAANEAKFVKQHGPKFFMQDVQQGHAAPPPEGRFLRSDSRHILGTLVKQIRWKGKPYPGSEINRNCVRLPGWGRVFFGEVLIGKCARRLTLIRAKLGSIDGGDFGGGDVQDGGTWS